MEKIKLEDIRVKENSATSSFPKEKREEVFVPKIELKKTKPVKVKRKKPLKISSGFQVGKALIVALYVSIIISAFFWGSNFFQKAKMELKVRREKIDHSSTIIGLSLDKKDYEIMINTETYNESVGFSNSEKISFKSQGAIKLFNYFSTSPIYLSAGSFVKDDRGYPYILKSNVSIPGLKSEDDVVTPGEVEVKIEAFLAGEIYNGEPVKFTIDSFEGTNKFEKVHGHLTEELTGGIEGKVYNLSEEDKVSLVDLVNSRIKSDIINQSSLLIPEGYIFYPTLSGISYSIEDEITSDKPALKIPIRVTLGAVLIKKDNLKKIILEKSIENLEETEVDSIKLEGLEDMEVVFEKKEEIDKNTKEIKLKIDGTLEAIWFPDINIVKKELVGRDKEEILSILKKNKGIEAAKISIYPPWQKYMPEEESRIDIVLD